MCTVLGVARSTYYKSFDKTKSTRELENEELKSAIKRIYKENKGIYGAPRIHYILGIEGFNVSLKRVQRLMTELDLCSITVKKYKPHSSKKVLKSAIKRIYKENKGIYGAPRIHYILGIEGFNVSLKRVQRRMSELGLYAITVKKYKPHSSKKVAEGLENVLKRDFTTTSINEKWVGDITYIHTIKDGWCYLASKRFYNYFY